VFDQWLASGSLLSSGGIPSTSFVGALAPFSCPFGGGGRIWKSQPRLVKEGFCSRPIWSFLLSILFHQLSHTGLSLLGRKLQMEGFSLWNQGVVGEVDIRGKGLFSGGEKIFFFKESRALVRLP